MRYRCAVGVLVAIIGLVLIGHIPAGQMSHGDNTIQLENAWARRTPPMAQQEQGSHGGSALSPENSAVYVTVKNHGREPDALIAAATNVATIVELHEAIEKDGKIIMRPRPQFDIQAGGTLEMKPGSYHIMLLGLKQALKPGDTVKVTLTFREAGQRSVEAPVR